MHHQVKLDSFVHSLNGFFLLDSSGVLRILSKLSRRHAILLDPSQIGCMQTYTKYLKLTNSDLSLMLLHDCVEGFNTTMVMNLLALSMQQGLDRCRCQDISSDVSV